MVVKFLLLKQKMEFLFTQLKGERQFQRNKRRKVTVFLSMLCILNLIEHLLVQT